MIFDYLIIIYFFYFLFYNFIMTESKLKKKKIDSEFNNRNNENLITGRSSKSLDQLTLRNNIISPWSGD